MTDPRIAEIEARLRRSMPTYALHPDSRETLADADLRYLLDRVREQSEAIHRSWRVYDRYGSWTCAHCGAYSESDADHAPSCIVLTIPAPEPVETQNAAP